MTPAEQAEVRRLAGEGASTRAIARALNVSHVAVAGVLRRAAAEPPPAAPAPADPAEPLPVIELPALEAEPIAPEPPALSPAEQRRLATRAKLEAEAARDNLRGYRELRQERMTFTNNGGKHPAPPSTDPALAAIEARRHGRDRVRMSVADRRGLGKYYGTI